MSSNAPTSRALVLEAPRRLVVRELAVPEIGADDALVRVEACGLCGTDHEQYTGALSGGFAFVPGHETVGIIEAIGPQAARRWGVAAGDRVAVEVFQSCRQCPNCLAGEYRRCERHGLADMYGFIPVDRAPGLWGGYAEYQYLAPDSMVLPVPAGLDPAVASLFNPLGAGIRWGATLPGTGAGDVVAVLGPGVRGLCAAAAAKEAGAGFVMLTGLGPRDADRLALAPQFGLTSPSTSPRTTPWPRCMTRRVGWPTSSSTSPPRRRRRSHRRSRSRGLPGRSWSPAPEAWAPARPDSRRTWWCSRSCAYSARSGWTPPPTGRRWRCWHRVATRSRACRDAACASTMPRSCSPPWPASVPVCRPCTEYSRHEPAAG
ncbi:alcohol dehydrogenase GroES-like domain protein [Mycobacterium kansasii]|uniref:Alcohol dehydrogenase GroES-like domain protein n=1 Tax=Mycobacterium kansasii TaxID=1768 RepID=A0A1V3XJK6_MYCKA|nr:alcohol dehydrogenase GroES-like domain protein [Mycobacterium kansasii]